MVELRPVRRAGDRVAAGADAGRLAGSAGGGRGRRGGARRPASHAADVGNRPRPLPPRRGRGRGAGLVRHPAGELGSGQVLPRLQLGVRADDASLRQDRGLVPPPERHRAPRLRRPDRFDGLRLHPRPQRVRPHPGQGLPGGEHPVARFGLAGAHGRGDRGGREDRPRYARRGPHGGRPGAVVRPERQQLELRQHVRHPQAVPRTAGTRAHAARPSRAVSARACSERCRRPACSPSGRRRCGASATPAASS